jgi:hypothetical protein
MMEQRSLFGLSEHLERISKIGDPLEVLESIVDSEYFRGWLVEGLGYGDGAKGVQLNHCEIKINHLFRVLYEIEKGNHGESHAAQF